MPTDSIFTTISACAVCSEISRNPDARILVHVKSNLCARLAPLRFHFSGENNRTRIVWDGPAQGIPAHHALSAADDMIGPLADALSFLRETLGAGPIPSQELLELAVEQGISKATYNRARARITRAVRVGGGAEGAWITSLRSPPPL